MFVLLDIDGVLVTTPPWKSVELLSDGFMKFNETAVKNLNLLVQKIDVEVVLTTTHRINYEVEIWKEIFALRGLHFEKISKINDASIGNLIPRSIEVENWVSKQEKKLHYMIIDDDLSLHGLSKTMKNRWVCTKPLLGFNEEALKQALILTQ